MVCKTRKKYRKSASNMKTILRMAYLKVDKTRLKARLKSPPFLSKILLSWFRVSGKYGSEANRAKE
jgi:hypothetical protein